MEEEAGRPWKKTLKVYRKPQGPKAKKNPKSPKSPLRTWAHVGSSTQAAHSGPAKHAERGERVLSQGVGASTSLRPPHAAAVCLGGWG